MENASNALIIAGTILISILIITMGVSLYTSFSETSDSYLKQLDATELQKYNSNFDVFAGRDDIVPQEIVTLISLVQQKGQGTTISLDGDTDCMTWDESRKSMFLQDKIEESKNNNGEITLYKCENILYNETTGKVREIEFIQKP